MRLNNSAFLANEAAGDFASGGALAVRENAQLSILGGRSLAANTCIGNATPSGFGGCLYAENSLVALDQFEISQNDYLVGVIASIGAEIDVSNAVIHDNNINAVGAENGLFNLSLGSRLQLSQSTIDAVNDTSVFRVLDDDSRVHVSASVVSQKSSPDTPFVGFANGNVQTVSTDCVIAHEYNQTLAINRERSSPIPAEVFSSDLFVSPSEDYRFRPGLRLYDDWCGVQEEPINGSDGHDVRGYLRPVDTAVGDQYGPFAVGAVESVDAANLRSVRVRSNAFGRVKSNIRSLYCQTNDQCMDGVEAEVPSGTAVRLFVDYDASLVRFLGWRNCPLDDLGSSEVCTFNVDDNTEVVAEFASRSQHVARVIKSGEGQGLVRGEYPDGSDAALQCGDVCLESFADDVLLTLIAESSNDHVFLHWEDCPLVQGDRCDLEGAMDFEVTAVFEPRNGRNLLDVSLNNHQAGSVIATTGEIDCPQVCRTLIEPDRTIRLEATPRNGFVFESWAGCTAEVDGFCHVSMAESREVSVVFQPEPETRQLLVNVIGPNGGSIVSNPAGIDCGETCLARFELASTVRLSPNPEENFEAIWTSCPAIQANGDCLVSINGDRFVEVEFRESIALQRVLVELIGDGYGEIVSDPQGMQCSDVSCFLDIPQGQSVVLSAIADAGSTFVQWEGCSLIDDFDRCVVFVGNTGAEITALFREVSNTTLSLRVNGDGEGAVHIAPPGQDCQTDCQIEIALGTEVTLEAIPNNGNYLEYWRGCNRVAGNLCTITMDENKIITTSFDDNPAGELSVTVVGTGGGNVISDDARVNCTGRCSTEYRAGDRVTLLAVADAASRFWSWMGCDEVNDNECIVNVQEMSRVTAEFLNDDPERQILSINITGNGEGDVVSNPGGINCGFDCESAFLIGAPLVLKAGADQNSRFIAWQNCPAVSGNFCNLTMTDDEALIGARFEPQGLQTFDITTSVLGNGLLLDEQGWIDCQSECSTTFLQGETVRITAHADEGEEFLGWASCPLAQGEICVVEDIQQNTQVQAKFSNSDGLDPRLRVAVGGHGDGQIRSIDQPGIDCPLDCDQRYGVGTSITLRATPDNASRFAFWVGCPDVNGNECKVLLNQNIEIEAIFAPDLVGGDPTLTVQFGGDGAGFVVSENINGIDCPDDCNQSFQAGSVIKLGAAAAVGSRFDGWQNCPFADGTACIVEMPAADLNIEAVFVAEVVNQDPELTITLSGDGVGTVVSDNIAGIDCPADCAERYAVGTTVKLGAAAAAGSRFDGWVNCPVADGTACIVEMPAADLNIEAVFVAEVVNQDPELTITLSGDGVGTVVSDNIAGIDCPADCAEHYAVGTTVKLGAAAAVGSRFDGWQNCPFADGTACIVEMPAADLNIEAVFVAEVVNQDPELTITLSGDGVGTVVSDNIAGIDCPADCAERYAVGTTVKLGAAAAAGSIFDGWQNCPLADGTACIVEMPAVDLNIEAVFVAEVVNQDPELTITLSGDGAGTVVSDNIAGIDCPADCAERYGVGTTVKLGAAAAAGSIFDGWQNCPFADGTACIVEMPAADLNIEAVFVAEVVNQDPELTITLSGDGVGTVVSDNIAGIDCPADCAEHYAVGTTVKLGAAAAVGSRFDGWQNCPFADGTACIVEMPAADLNIEAVFVAEVVNQDPELRITLSGDGVGTVVSDNIAGIDCPADCAERYAVGTTVKLGAAAAAGSIFDGWQNCPLADGTACIVEMPAADLNIEAVFVAEVVNQDPELTITLSGDGVGTVVSDNIAGIDCPADCAEHYAVGTTVKLGAAAAAGSIFDGWQNCPFADGTACIVEMPAADLNIEAVFVQEVVNEDPLLTVMLSGDGLGSVLSDNLPGIDCPGDCSEQYALGTALKLVAVAAEESVFAEWFNCPLIDDDVCIIEIPAEDMVVEAVFVAEVVNQDPELTITLSGDGVGTVVSDNIAGIDCPADCAEHYAVGTTVKLGAAAAAGSIFDGWQNCPFADGTACIVEMPAADLNIEAVFVQEVVNEDPLLTVMLSGDGLGSVLSDNLPGIDCPGDCSEQYALGTALKLVAVAAEESVFAEWVNCPLIDDDVCIIEIPAEDMVVEAVFVAEVVNQDPELTITLSGDGVGTVVSDNIAGIDCPADCAERYAVGTTVKLGAAAAAGSIFDGWQNCPFADGTACIVEMPAADLNIEAVFVQEVVNEDPLLTVMLSGDGLGTVLSDNLPGIDCPGDCSEQYALGTALKLVAVAAEESVFAEWVNCPLIDDDVCIIEIPAEDMVVEAVFVSEVVNQDPELTVTLSGDGVGAVISENRGGIDCPGDCSERYGLGTVVTLGAMPAEGNLFQGWSNCPAPVGNICTLEMVANGVNIEAIFAPTAIPEFRLSIILDGVGRGSVRSTMNDAIDCPGECAADFEEGRLVTLRAQAEADNEFVGWQNCPASGQDGEFCTVTMSEDRLIRAIFARDAVVEGPWLTAASFGNGVVMSTNEAGINCEPECERQFLFGSHIILRALPDAGHVFEGWQNCPEPNADTCIVILEEDTAVSANFRPDADELREITVMVNGTGLGQVIGQLPVQLLCKPDCVTSLLSGTQFQISAVAAQGSIFSGWLGCPQSAGNQCTGTLEDDLTITAMFDNQDLTHPMLDIEVLGEGTGFVVSRPEGVNCPGDCSAAFEPNTFVQIHAIADPGSVFQGWDNCVAPDGNQCTLESVQDTLIAAMFEMQEPNMVPLTIVLDGDGFGQVTSNDQNINCGSDCLQNYVAGSSIALRAEPAEGSEFDSWVNCPEPNGDVCEFTIESATEVEAVFSNIDPQLSTVEVEILGGQNSTVSSQPVGIACPQNCEHSFPQGSVVSLTAFTARNEVFLGWNNCPEAMANTCLISVESDISIEAQFDVVAPQSAIISMDLSGNGIGFVESDVPGIDCPGLCEAAFALGERIRLTATAAENSNFEGWVNCPLVEGNDCIVEVAQDVVIEAQFSSIEMTTVSVTVGGDAVGGVLIPDGQLCQAQCAFDVPIGNMVELRFDAPSSSTLAAWIGCDAVTGNVCTVIVDEDKNISAFFEAALFRNGFEDSRFQ